MAVWGIGAYFPGEKEHIEEQFYQKGNNHIRLYKRTETRLL